jgi:hypothetical protein
MRKPFFQLAKLVDGTPDRKPWFIIETHITSDGPRTRVCDGRWPNDAEAAHEMRKRQAGWSPPQPPVPVMPQAVLYGGSFERVPRNLGGIEFPTPEEMQCDEDLGLVHNIPAKRIPPQREPYERVIEPATPVASWGAGRSEEYAEWLAKHGPLTTVNTPEQPANAFVAVMYEQYGSWTFSVGHKDRNDALRFTARTILTRTHCKHINVIDVPFVPAPDAEEGIWVCVFKRYDLEWRVTNGFENRAAAIKHRDNVLMTPNMSQRFTNVSVRCLPYPESYRG